MTLLFDLINTLLKFNSEIVCTRFSGWSGFTPERVRDILWDGTNCGMKALTRSFMLGLVDSNEFLLKLRKEFRINPEVHDWLLQEAFLHFHIDPRILRLLYFLQAQKFSLGLISNIDKSAWEFIQSAFPVFSKNSGAFRFVVLSYKVQALKPDPLLFQAAKAKARSDIICYFDDREENCESAEKVGIPSVLVGGDPYMDITNAFSAFGVPLPPADFKPAHWMPPKPAGEKVFDVLPHKDGNTPAPSARRKKSKYKKRNRK